MSTPTTTPTPMTETRRFKVMGAIIGAANPLMRRLLDSRFARGLGRALLLLEFKGRRSGRTYRTPVSYVREGDRLILVTSPRYAWWKNVVGGAPVRVRLPEGWRHGEARVLLPDDPGYDDAVATQVRGRGPQMLRGFGIEVDDQGRIDPATRPDGPSRAHIVEIRLTDRAAA